MFIKVEPAGFFMHTVKLIFDLDEPTPEDQLVRDYLAEHELEPRYRWDDQLEDNRAEVIQFGGCYLGNHLQTIGQIQRKVVEEELLTAELSSHLDSMLADQTRQPSIDQRETALRNLVAEFHQDSSFQANDAGEWTAVLDSGEVEKAVRRELGLG